jgi:ATP-dependent DNA helicase RecG
MDLKDSVEILPFVGERTTDKLAKLGIATIQDLLHHIPRRYIDFRKTVPIAQAQIGEVVTLQGKIISITNVFTKNRKQMQKAVVADDTGRINVLWFNQPYLLYSLKKDLTISLAGEVSLWREGRTLLTPEYEIAKSNKKALHTGRLIPVYPETASISSKWLRARIDHAFKQALDENLVKEFLPPDFLLSENFLDFKSALLAVHYPKDLAEAEKGRERLALNELLFLELNNLQKRQAWRKTTLSQKLSLDQKLIQEFIAKLPFKLTAAQEKATQEILTDLTKDQPMNRLLEGDVGSGKTVVAAVAAFVAFLNGKQSVFMAPTQILAQQHYQTLKSLLAPFKVRLALLTSTSKKKDLGRTDLFIGTHALLDKKTNFENTALTVIDEQHRFGVKQRALLIKKGKSKKLVPHVLTMTATPIPRTVAMTLYGDLDLSILDELPKGRQKITTWLVPPAKRESAYQWIAAQKTQTFMVCPLIEESDKETMSDVKAVKSEYEKLKKLLPKLKIGLLHGRLKSKEKERVVKSFRQGKTDILVATPVVEVGIDIPQATIMVIEAAERFGLASLHQLRGRVGRSDQKSYCLLFTESASPKVQTRLEALKRNLSGFELAEIDLKMRGPGEVFGLKQHGFNELKIASWQDEKLIKLAKELARKLYLNQNG